MVDSTPPTAGVLLSGSGVWGGSMLLLLEVDAPAEVLGANRAGIAAAAEV